MSIRHIRDVGRKISGIRSILLVIFLIVSILSNIVMFVGSVIYSFVDDAFAAATGITTAITTERKEKRVLRNEKDKLRKTLAQEQRKNLTLKSKNTKLSKSVDRTTRTIRRRALRSATLNLASMPIEAVPYIGVAVIVTSTAVEIRDLCQIIDDLDDLRSDFGLSDAMNEEEVTACGIPVPPKDELIKKAGSSLRKSWEEVQNLLEDRGELLPDVSEDDWKHIEDGARGLTNTILNSPPRTLRMIRRWWSGDTNTDR